MRSPSPAARRAAVALAAITTITVAGPIAAIGIESTPTAAAFAIERGATVDAGYAQHLSDREPTGYSVGWGKLYLDASYDGEPLSLLADGRERTFDTGMFAHAPSTICYNDIQDYGYETFESWVGVGASARADGKSARVVFKVVGDGEVLWESPEMTELSDAEFVSVDISHVRVLELVAEATDKGAHPNNHTIWADASFGKPEATPWLSASDKEFAIPDQVTPENILEGVFARTLSGDPGSTDEPVRGPAGTLRNGREGNDLSNEVTYTTDYIAGETGTFNVTYRVEDGGGLVRERTVKMTVRDRERTKLDADLDYLTSPFASFLYTGRDYLDEQGKAAFDLSVSTLLDFGDNVDAYPLVTRWGESVYRIDIDLYAAGIRVSAADAAYLTSTILDNEPRCFHVKDWGTSVSSKNGLAGTVSFFVPERYGQKDGDGEAYYHARLLATEANATRFLSNQKDGMTDAQRLRAVLYPYADWISYKGGQMMDEALADGQSVCGGNARGSAYLCQRMGIKAYWVRTNSHAWSNVKLNHDDSGASEGRYYRVDLLARPGCFLSIDAAHEGFHGHHKEIFFDRAKGYPDMVSEGYPFAWTSWPSISLTAEESITVLAPEDAANFDAMSLVSSATSIYQGDLIDRVTVDDGGLEEDRTEGGFAAGLYKIVFSVEDDRGNTANATAYVQVVDGEVAAAGADSVTSNNGATFEGVSLWNGRCEVPYAVGIRQNDTRSTTFDIEGKGYSYFDAWVGINGTVRQNVSWGMNGRIQPEVWATIRKEDGSTEEVNLYTGPIMGWYAVQEHVLVAIPENAIAITLKNTDKGAGNSHAGWGNPRFFTGDVLDEVPVPPTITGIEDGATYSAAVTPVVERADSVELYRKELPVVVDTETGLPVDAEAGDEVATRAAADPDWGELVEGYRAGDEVDAEGVYTLAASNKYGQQTVVRFTIDLDEPESGDGGEGDTVPPAEGDGAGDESESGNEDGQEPGDGDSQNPDGDGDGQEPGDGDGQSPGDGEGAGNGEDAGDGENEPDSGEDTGSDDEETPDAGNDQQPDDNAKQPAGDQGANEAPEDGDTVREEEREDSKADDGKLAQTSDSPVLLATIAATAAGAVFLAMSRAADKARR